MRALVHHGPHDIRIQEVPEPSPGPGELLLAPRCVGVCVSDKHAYEGLMYGPPWTSGLVPGHEFDAVVVAAGDGVEGWAAGERVAVDPRVACGMCRQCRAGLASLCERGAEWIGVRGRRGGAYAERCVAPAANCHRLPAAVPDGIGALVEPAASVLRSLRRSGLRPGDDALVLGAEDYALLLVQLLVEAGAGAIVVADPSLARRASALASGATLAVDPTAPDARRTLRAALPLGADVAFASMKEITVRHAGVFYGDEPARGGAERGDWRLALDAIAAGCVVPIPGSETIAFSDLRDASDVAALFGAVGTAPKLLVAVGA